MATGAAQTCAAGIKQTSRDGDALRDTLLRSEVVRSCQPTTRPRSPGAKVPAPKTSKHTPAPCPRWAAGDLFCQHPGFPACGTQKRCRGFAVMAFGWSPHHRDAHIITHSVAFRFELRTRTSPARPLFPFRPCAPTHAAFRLQHTSTACWFPLVADLNLKNY